MFVQRLAIGGSGPRVVLKDTIDLAGVPTGCGSRALVGAAAADTNAEVVDRLLAAGFAVVGKVTLHELAFGVTGINDWAGTPVNPADPARVPGGSSSGCAVAIASNTADIAIGTDTGGSIRIPAACCGVVGFKPTFGLISRRGVLPAVSSLDCVGPLARDIDGICLALRALIPNFEPASPNGLRIGRIAVEADPEIAGAIDVALACSELCLKVAPIELELDAAFDAALTIINHETFRAFGDLLTTGLLGSDVAARLKAAGQVTKDELLAAETIRTRFRQAVDACLERVDILALPTMPVFPPLLEEARANRSGVALTRFVRPFNLSGHPAVSIPIRTQSGRLAALQLVGRHGDDARLCAAAQQVQARLNANDASPGGVADA